MLGDLELSETMVVDVDAMDARHQLLFQFLDRVNGAPSTVTAAELATLREAGWTDRELYFAVTVCALFNFYNRWIDATGVHGMSDVAHRVGGKRLAETGYIVSATEELDPHPPSRSEQISSETRQLPTALSNIGAG